MLGQDLAMHSSGVKNAGSYDSEIGPFDWKAALPDQVGTAVVCMN